MIEDAIHRITMHRAELTRDEARAVMGEVLAGRATEAQIGALLVALVMRGETVEEIAGFAEAIRAAATPIRLQHDSALDVSGTERDALVDTCGTGGDASGTFNISTATALVVAGAGVRVAKHGNRSSTAGARCGSADVMEALGVKIDIPAKRLAQSLEKVGIAFIFAQAVHSAMRYVAPVRKQLKLRTVMNLLGPLTNPAGASSQVVGVYSRELVPKLAQALRQLGLKRALVVHGHDGLDEITLSAPTHVAELRDNAVLEYDVTPEQFGLARAPLQAILGGDAEENARIIHWVLRGDQGAHRDIVLLNAAAALLVAGRATSIAEALPLAAEAIDSGAAQRKLEQLVEFTNRTS